MSVPVTENKDVGAATGLPNSDDFNPKHCSMSATRKVMKHQRFIPSNLMTAQILSAIHVSEYLLLNSGC